jgi:hypothetical protein
VVFVVAICSPTMDQVSTTLNTEGEEKLQEEGWLISTILVKFNHLRGRLAGKLRRTDQTILSLTSNYGGEISHTVTGDAPSCCHNTW